MNSIETCAICGGRLDSVLAVHTAPDRFEVHLGISAENYSRRWLVCGQCGSASNIMDPANAARLAKLADGYYEVDFSKSSVQEKFAKVMALPEDKSDNAGRVKRVIAQLDTWRQSLGLARRPARVLDIGAGTGVFLAKLLQSKAQTVTNWHATVIEPDRVAAEHLRELNKFDVIQGVFDAASVMQLFDLVTLNKVVEHLPKPQALMSGVANALDPDGGIVYIEVPDVLTIGRRLPTDNILGSLHHHLYSPRGLTFLIEGVGLRLLAIGRTIEPSGKITLFGFACADVTFDSYARNEAS
jgi:2-polyprenyl-3-methyl-5-hydroxy-6-metoxy-1,4-benzoquinol methylase